MSHYVRLDTPPPASHVIEMGVSSHPSQVPLDIIKKILEFNGENYCLTKAFSHDWTMKKRALCQQMNDHNIFKTIFPNLAPVSDQELSAVTRQIHKVAHHAFRGESVYFADPDLKVFSNWIVDPAHFNDFMNQLARKIAFHTELYLLDNSMILAPIFLTGNIWALTLKPSPDCENDCDLKEILYTLFALMSLVSIPFNCYSIYEIARVYYRNRHWNKLNQILDGHLPEIKQQLQALLAPPPD